MPLLTSQQTIRVFILGLPIGLLITGTAAMFIYFHLEDVNEDQSGRVPVRRELAETDLRAYVRTLSSGIGPRHAGAPETLSSASKYFQSTLGPLNMGFKVSRHEFQVDGEPYYNLELELPGAPGPRAAELVLVTANYDSAPVSPGANQNASGMAAVMSLAQNFAGVAFARTVRFVVLVNEAPPLAGTPRSGSAAYASSLRTRQEKVAAVICLEGMGRYLDEPGSQKFPPGPAAPFPDSANFLALIANPGTAAFLPALKAEFITATKLPLEAEDATSQPALLGEATAKTFDAAGFPVLRLTDTGALRDPNAYQPGDTMDKLDYPRFLEAVRGTEAVIRSMANPTPSSR